VHLVPGIE
jgi:hypothetical protein